MKATAPAKTSTPPCVSGGSSRTSAVSALPSIVGVKGSSITPQERAPAATSSGLRRSASAANCPALTTLPPSLAKIASKDVVVEVRGMTQSAPFRLGGKHGNIIISSTMSKIHRGWRIVGVSGQRIPPQEVASALSVAQKTARYTLTFRIGEEKGEGEDDDDLARQEAEEERRRKEAEAALEAERQLQLQAEAAEALRRKKEEEEREAAEAAAKQRLKEQQEAEDKKRADALKVARKEVEQTLEKKAGLPPREKVKEPQRALMQALTRPVAPPKVKKPQGPCDKCDGPHDTDECPHFKKAREEHKDAWDKYGSKKGGKSGDDDDDSGAMVIKSAKVVHQPGDGSCLFHSLSYGLKSKCASALRAEIADYIAGNPDVVVAGNAIRDWVLWDSGLDPASYAATMREGSRWGGAVEIAVCAQKLQVHIDIFERCSEGFARISSFGAGSGQGAATSAKGPTLSLLYGGRVHYDALER
eukprot:TRINITY_DN72353_c0_g1_i1.p1 TRINITY_DN72353_c0_g1~~TRINITY_DN72353_c0_g1_i1.p1  ORF type:complete len:473 (-),score=85.27 TRINITY_DN72353_c0_g1_i1:60-1478(-)